MTESRSRDGPPGGAEYEAGADDFGDGAVPELRLWLHR